MIGPCILVVQGPLLNIYKGEYIMAKLIAPENATGCSHEGVEYDVDEKGFVEVPEEAVSALLDHGFKTVPAERKAKQ